MSEFRPVGPGFVAPKLREALLVLRQRMSDLRTQLEEAREVLEEKKRERLEISESRRSHTE